MLLKSSGMASVTYRLPMPALLAAACSSRTRATIGEALEHPDRR